MSPEYIENPKARVPRPDMAVTMRPDGLPELEYRLIDGELEILPRIELGRRPGMRSATSR
jgi:hypothetical protein